MMTEYSGHLNLNQSFSQNKFHDGQRKCSCMECNNIATVFLNVVHLPSSGYFCSQSSTDLKWHGIAHELVPDEEERVD